MIDKLGGINPVSRFNNLQNYKTNSKKVGKDTVSISDDAKRMSEIYTLKEKIKMTPDIRMDKVQEVMSRMEDPNYIENAINGTVDKIMEDWGL